MEREQLVAEISGKIFQNIGDHDHKKAAEAVVSFLEEKGIKEEPNPETVVRCIHRIADLLGDLPVWGDALGQRANASDIVRTLIKEFGFIPKEVSNVKTEQRNRDAEGVL